ncbi:MAG: DUF971 domain-containing protein [Planctomycetota bacterium]|jgi:ATP-binding protein involved in chromosome partitioning|nr:DUF971 domain-containing protein [Planctomycetota bacterium]
MNTNTPKVITKSDPARISIAWADGQSSSYSAAELRRICPCAHCVDELTGRKLLDPKTVPQDLLHRQVRLVGRYALGIEFSDGHQTGLYQFDFLRSHAPVDSAPTSGGTSQDQ